MYNNRIIYISGVHGVGKDTICSILEKRLGLKHLSSSKILKWDEYSINLKNKRVSSVEETQNSFVENFKSYLEGDLIYILDGHFALLTATYEIEDIPMFVYDEIKPLIIILITLAPNVIISRLRKRDSMLYDVNIVNELQERERGNAYNVGRKLGIDVVEINNTDIEKSIELIENVINKLNL